MRPLSPTPILLAALAMASAAHAQDTAQAYDPNNQPSYREQVQLFTLTPPGDIDGLILTHGTEVKTPPYLSTALALTIRPGDTITVRGLKAAQLPLVQALSVTNDATGKSVTDFGPGHEGPVRTAAAGGPKRRRRSAATFPWRSGRRSSASTSAGARRSG